ncbi:unnamed protein product [Citrullus colocynthis]|uniref:NB-ARC domain-containing protein n=1 Tax=Citrullus colocynthis TaxID=252529 RepID=A0ABP0Y5E7_9ROSI
MGGIGKTTIAEVVYEKFAHKFMNSCFVRIGGQSLISLQQQLLSQLLTKDIKILNENHGVRMIMDYLRSHKKVFIVFDGINEKRQLEMLAGNPDWYCQKSRIIITTRNKDILRQPNYQDKVQEYNVELLSDTSASSLFCKHAFVDDPPDENLKDLCNEIIEKVGRLPLALVKIASSLYAQSIDIWEETLRSYPKVVYDNIFFDILKTSYEGLEEETQQIFLDLACFFNGEKVDRVIEILKGFGYTSPRAHPKLKLLVDRSLIDISDEHIQIHNLILCLGQEIVRREPRTRQQTRIWQREDARRLFHVNNNIVYFAKKKKKNNNSYWRRYMENLTEIHIDGTFINQVSPSITYLIHLVVLNLRNCIRLSCLPTEMGCFTSLKTLILNGCKNLDQIPPSVGNVVPLEELDIGGTSITAIPFLENLRILNCERLKSNIWHSLAALPTHYFRSLKDLNLSDCNLANEDIPDDLGLFSSLEILDLSSNHFESLPESMEQLINLKALYLNDCYNLKQVPKLPESLRYVEEKNPWTC